MESVLSELKFSSKVLSVLFAREKGVLDEVDQKQLRRWRIKKVTIYRVV